MPTGPAPGQDTPADLAPNQYTPTCRPPARPRERLAQGPLVTHLVLGLHQGLQLLQRLALSLLLTDRSGLGSCLGL